jgi:hypothetical protein
MRQLVLVVQLDTVADARPGACVRGNPIARPSRAAAMKRECQKVAASRIEERFGPGESGCWRGREHGQGLQPPGLFGGVDEGIGGGRVCMKLRIPCAGSAGCMRDGRPLR